jgi:NAD(P)-dependent dehydrogenase (short-subunit alcohol dehydrogenase family)
VVSEPDRVKQAEPYGLRLDGRTVIVTGASSGLGVQFAEALASAGANLVLAARRRDRMEAVAARIQGDHAVVACDVVSERDRAEVIQTALDRFGRIDGLVNNAGAADIRPALKVSTEDFARIIDVNLIAPFALSRDVAMAMRGQRDGAIVNIASVAGLQPISWQPMVSYVASKTGLVGMTRELASQWGRYNIRVNAICPGPFPSEMSGSEYESGPAFEKMRSAVPLQRVGRKGELNCLLLTLLHPANAFMTGQAIAVDGGLSSSL